jgi:hypothetical protein
MRVEFHGEEFGKEFRQMADMAMPPPKGTKVFPGGLPGCYVVKDVSLILSGVSGDPAFAIVKLEQISFSASSTEGGSKAHESSGNT